MTIGESCHRTPTSPGVVPLLSVDYMEMACNFQTLFSGIGDLEK